jgi:hypothetical protein
MRKVQRALFDDYFEDADSDDYYLIHTKDDIEFYAPEDETWGAIVAVSRENRLAKNTGFFELDDMVSEYTDYHQIVDNGRICCAFETDQYTSIKF